MDMETSPETDNMLEEIRKELIKIVEKDENLEKETPATADNKEDKYKIKSLDLSEIVAQEENIADKIQANELAAKDQFMSSLHCDVQKMQLDLDKTYALFRTISDRFSNINFSGLDKRIKDLDLNKKSTSVGAGDATPNVAMQIREMLDKSYRDKTLNQLTENVSKLFSLHPGEFGDIPEVSNFFQACTQLQHGLNELKVQGNTAQELGERLQKAAEEKYQRMEEINKLLSKQDDRKPTNPKQL